MNILKRPKIFWTLVSLVAIAAFVTRFWAVANKPFHHDESLHAYYSQRVAQGNPHVYDGMLHGPILYYIVGGFMFFAGVSDWTAHIPASFFGFLIVLSPLFVRRYIGNGTTLATMLLLLVSPSNMYFGRFLREDVFVTSWIIGFMLSLFVYTQTRKVSALYFATAMLAFHFVNKESSYLHSALWGMGMLLTVSLSKKTGAEFPHCMNSKQRTIVTINSIAIFATIFILFYSAFFQHPQGILAGIWDGLYEKSLKYWWEQDQKRRIDGPFDYYIPLLANYEFLLIPMLASSWLRIVKLASKTSRIRESSPRFFENSVFGVAILLLLLLAPRLALVPEGCGISEFCLDTLSPSASKLLAPFAKHLHIAHTRHLLQIIIYCVMGAIAYFSSILVTRRIEAFLWFWLTGAFGIYSYVGEKVPWLILYILLPLIFICALELSRVIFRRELPFSEDASLESSLSWSRRLFPYMILWLVVAGGFTLFKSIRLSFIEPANPQERLVFTQTTNDVLNVRNRWREAVLSNPKHTLRVTVNGEATWPFAWYLHEFPGFDFSKPNAEKSQNFDVIILDSGELETSKKNFAHFKIYKLPLRAWWIPTPNPTLSGVLRYFFSGEPFVRPGTEGTTKDTGFGDTHVLYMERVTDDSPWKNVPPPNLNLLFSGDS